MSKIYDRPRVLNEPIYENVASCTRDLDEELFHPSKARDSLLIPTKEGLSAYSRSLAREGIYSNTRSLTRTISAPQNEYRPERPRLTNFGVYDHVPYTLALLLVSGTLCVVPDVLLMSHKTFVTVLFMGGVAAGVICLVTCGTGFIARRHPLRNCLFLFMFMNFLTVIAGVILLVANVPGGPITFVRVVRPLLSRKQQRRAETLMMVAMVWFFITATGTIIMGLWNCVLCIRALWFDPLDTGKPHLIELEKVVVSSAEKLDE